MRTSGLASASRLAKAAAIVCFTTGCFAGHRPRPAASAPVLAEDATLLPPRVRRLSNIEYQRTVTQLLGMQVAIVDKLPPDIRQSGYTRNVDQTLPAHSAQLLAGISEELAERAVHSRLDEFAPCHQRAKECQHETIQRLALEAWRRPATGQELSALGHIFEQGQATSGEFSSGLTWLLVALLQSPSLLYVSEQGKPDSETGVRRLGSFEIASSLAYLLTGGPPDAELLEAARKERIQDSTAREHHARRLLGKDSTRHHFRQFVLEWLEVDQLAKTAKDERFFPGYDKRKLAMLEETGAFVDEVMVHQGASVSSLLDAGFVSVEPEMARFYGLRRFGPRVAGRHRKRSGVLQQASFLAAHSHPDSTSPVKRGDFVLRRVLCEVLPRPTELDIEVTIPPVNASQTARERFSRHTSDSKCSFCHESIDALGFTFEEFDAVGALRQRDQNKTVDTKVSFRLGPISREFRDSLELSEFLSQSPRTEECFSRQAFRFFSAQADPRVEESFVALTKELPAERRGNLMEELIQFVKSDLFVLRQASSEKG